MKKSSFIVEHPLVTVSFTILAAVILITASCETLPEKPTGHVPLQSARAGESGRETKAEDSVKPAEEVSVQLPSGPAREQEKETAKLPDAFLELAEADYPNRAPAEGTSSPLPLPSVEPPPFVQQPPVQAPVAPPETVAPREAPQPAAVLPPPRRESPPPTPPPTARPSQPMPSPRQERDPPSVIIPDMPFQPVPAVPDPALSALAQPANENALPYSRTVKAQVGQYIEIPFRGSGWIYLGEFGSRRGVSYNSRRMEEEGMTFVFQAVTEGTYSLKFNRQDFVRDTILNDYVRVIVEQPPLETGAWSNSQVRPDRVYAGPRWPLPTDPEGTTRPAASAAAGGTIIEENSRPAVQTAESRPSAPTVQTAESRPGGTEQTGISAGTSIVEGTSVANKQAAPLAEDWLKKAWEEYNGGRMRGALDALDQFMIRYPGGSDDAYWLYGQSLEANNEATRDIRLALDYYRRLLREYPQSSRCDEARRRIAYLERFYFSIQ